ncbi:DUF4269 domain-containing protein [Paenibacillus woosongensis]|uniref:DUF4269 domain-containing protein n=1 Tax=Paenibacillus woosongensis TaxID=307580 RepID=A0A7X3CLG3_9BACL|nr:DUF4269 domain-containing protein [Paenibacillus woosongensis]MUG43960.1 DUF4269 domain-containing protein [Paenibacillus woosongensis]
MFKTISYLQFGTPIQRQAYKAINELSIINDMAKYNPVLCGTIPISIDVYHSDLDMIMEVHEPDIFKKEVQLLYGHLSGFVINELTVNHIPTIMANFRFEGFEFELFGQAKPVEQQNAYLHMIVEHHLLTANPHYRAAVIRLKEQGMKTEPAFAQVLGLDGDPYKELLTYGRALGIIR